MADLKFTLAVMMAALLLYTVIQLSFVPTHNDHAMFPRSTHTHNRVQRVEDGRRNAFTLDGNSITLRKTKSASNEHSARRNGLTSDEDGIKDNPGSADEISMSNHLSVNTNSVKYVHVPDNNVNARGSVEDLEDLRQNGINPESVDRLFEPNLDVNVGYVKEVSRMDNTNVNAKPSDLELQGELVAPDEIGANRRRGERSSGRDTRGRSLPVSRVNATMNDHQPTRVLHLQSATIKPKRENDPSFEVTLDSRSKSEFTPPSFETSNLINNGNEIENYSFVGGVNASMSKLPIVSGGFEKVRKELNELKMRSMKLQKSVEEIFSSFVNDKSSTNENILQSGRNISQNAVIKGGIFWSEIVEDALLPHIPESTVRAWRTDVRTRRVVRLLPGCGRERNRLAVLDNGEMLCIRYRQNFDQIQGEILSFYLSRLLAIDHVPLSVLLEVNRHSDEWISVKENITKAGWVDGIFVVATKYVPDLEPAYMPTQLRGKNRTLDLNSVKSNSTLEDFVELAQWSDLIVFDYLTANLDRIVNTHVNSQWNRFMFEQPVHNLELISTSDRHPRLLFLDNESGMLHGYRMLPRYGHYHERILNSLCVFRVHTVLRLLGLNAEEDNIWSLLKSKIEAEEPLFKKMPSFPLKFRETLRERISALVEHVRECKSKL